MTAAHLDTARNWIRDYVLHTEPTAVAVNALAEILAQGDHFRGIAQRRERADLLERFDAWVERRGRYEDRELWRVVREALGGAPAPREITK